MFPTLVWKIELEAQLREAICVRRSHARAHEAGLPSLAPGQGWQSAQSLHELDDFRISVCLACTASCREFCDS